MKKADFFNIINDVEMKELREAHKNFLDVTRPHIHPLLNINTELLEDLVTCSETNIRGLVDEIGLIEIVNFTRLILSSKTSVAAKNVKLPSSITLLTKGKLTENQRQVRMETTRLMYLTACQMAMVAGDNTPMKRLRALVWTSMEKFDLGLKFDALCSGCGAMGKVNLRNLENSDALSYFCDHCGHSYNREESESRRSYVECKCQMCRDQTTILLQDIRTIVSNSFDAIATRYQQWSSRFDSVEAWPTEDQMFRHYQLTKNSLGKDLRAIIALEPKSPQDFLECVKAYLEHHNGNFNSVIADALKMKLCYERTRYVATDSSTFVSLISSGACPAYEGVNFWGYGSITKREVRETLLKTLLYEENIVNSIVVRNTGVWLDTCDEDAKIISVLIFQVNPDLPYLSGLLSGEIRPENVTEYFLNDYFFGKTISNSKPLSLPNLIQPKVFRSITESNVYRRLISEYPTHIVVPNRLLRQIIDLRSIANSFTSDDYSYLRNCEIDFAIYDEEGFLIFVEELQRGDHHNAADWIRKDAIKRRALALANVSLVESF